MEAFKKKIIYLYIYVGTYVSTNNHVMLYIYFKGIIVFKNNNRYGNHLKITTDVKTKKKVKFINT